MKRTRSRVVEQAATTSTAQTNRSKQSISVDVDQQQDDQDNEIRLIPPRPQNFSFSRQAEDAAHHSPPANSLVSTLSTLRKFGLRSQKGKPSLRTSPTRNTNVVPTSPLKRRTAPPAHRDVFDNSGLNPPDSSSSSSIFPSSSSWHKKHELELVDASRKKQLSLMRNPRALVLDESGDEEKEDGKKDNKEEEEVEVVDEEELEVKEISKQGSNNIDNEEEIDEVEEAREEKEEETEEVEENEPEERMQTKKAENGKLQDSKKRTREAASSFSTTKQQPKPKKYAKILRLLVSKEEDKKREEVRKNINKSEQQERKELLELSNDEEKEANGEKSEKLSERQERADATPKKLDDVFNFTETDSSPDLLSVHESAPKTYSRNLRPRTRSRYNNLATTSNLAMDDSDYSNYYYKEPKRSVQSKPVIIDLSDDEDGKDQINEEEEEQQKQAAKLLKPRFGQNPKFLISCIYFGTHFYRPESPTFFEFHCDSVEFKMKDLHTKESVSLCIEFHQIREVVWCCGPKERFVALRTEQKLEVDKKGTCYDPKSKIQCRNYIAIMAAQAECFDEAYAHAMKKHSQQLPFKLIQDDEASRYLGVERVSLPAKSNGSLFDRSRTPTKTILVYPPPPNDKDAITLTAADVARLEPMELLNDNIIEFYLKHLQLNSRSSVNIADQCYFYNTFFWPKLNTCGRDKEKILKWTKNVDIFSKRFLIIPINESAHWNVIIVCNICSMAKIKEPEDVEKLPLEERPCLLYMCSLHLNNYSVTRKVKEYLKFEWEHRIIRGQKGEPTHWTKKVLPSLYPTVPLQENGVDCGVFLLHFVEKFLMDPPPSFDSESLMKRFSGEWFPLTDIQEKRAAVKALIERLKAQCNPLSSSDEEAEEEEEKERETEKEQEDDQKLKNEKEEGEEEEEGEETTSKKKRREETDERVKQRNQWAKNMSLNHHKTTELLERRMKGPPLPSSAVTSSSSFVPMNEENEAEKKEKRKDKEGERTEELRPLVAAQKPKLEEEEEEEEEVLQKEEEEEEEEEEDMDEEEKKEETKEKQNPIVEKIDIDEEREENEEEEEEEEEDYQLHSQILGTVELGSDDPLSEEMELMAIATDETSPQDAAIAAAVVTAEKGGAPLSQILDLFSQQSQMKQHNGQVSRSEEEEEEISEASEHKQQEDDGDEEAERELEYTEKKNERRKTNTPKQKGRGGRGRGSKRPRKRGGTGTAADPVWINSQLSQES
ncbi:cysteine-type peptidase [Balamuthia mandrillaris]